jgi:ubiquitin carboxyl-terminal hydrolase 9/24
LRINPQLYDSLEQYVKGRLLGGGNVYYCEKCNIKMNTVKRLCVKKLPPILTIHLKRFEYDYERLCPIKFNDYFEFPRVLDMEPYTVWGLAKAEGEVIDYDIDEESNRDVSTLYHLTGIVVHSGQASCSHYYSYILCPPPNDESGSPKWYKFDDRDVSECKMDDDEEMKNQCFGGEYMGRVCWLNAHILFYRRELCIHKRRRGHQRSHE